MDAKLYYERVVETAKRQTGGPGYELPPATLVWSLRTVCCAHGGVPPERFELALQAASDNGEIVVGSGFVTPAAPRERVRAAIPHVAARADAPQAFVAAANGVLS